MHDSLKEKIKELNADELDELISHAVLIKRLREPETQEKIKKIAEDENPENWVSVDDFESLLATR